MSSPLIDWRGLQNAKLQNGHKASLFLGYICLASQKRCFGHEIAARTQNADGAQKPKYSTKMLIQSQMLPDRLV